MGRGFQRLAGMTDDRLYRLIAIVARRVVDNPKHYPKPIYRLACEAVLAMDQIRRRDEVASQLAVARMLRESFRKVDLV